MRTIAIAFVLAVLTSACASSGAKQDSTMAIGSAEPPQLWSDHKRLDIPLGECAERAFNVLKALGYSGVVKNGNYSYGNFNENRTAVKCVESGEGSFVYFAVAGSKKEVVEQLRNQIAWKL